MKKIWNERNFMFLMNFNFILQDLRMFFSSGESLKHERFLKQFS